MPSLFQPRIVNINKNLSKPIYKQIISSIQLAIIEKRLQKGDQLPSVNAIAEDHAIARGSIFKAYNDLRSTGIISSTPGRGFHVVKTDFENEKHIFLLLSSLNPQQEAMYHAFRSELEGIATVELFFHYHNMRLFEALIRKNALFYTSLVIEPEINKRTDFILKKLDPHKVFIIDKGLKEYGQYYPCVCQHYEENIFSLLKTHCSRLKKYKRVVLLFPDGTRETGIKNGFIKFFDIFDFPNTVIENTQEFEPEQHDACITVDDNDLVRVVHLSQLNGWKPGHDIGIISYNEAPLKSVVAGGITTITSDFKNMGYAMAQMILNEKKERVENPFIMVERGSF